MSNALNLRHVARRKASSGISPARGKFTEKCWLIPEVEWFAFSEAERTAFIKAWGDRLIIVSNTPQMQEYT
jgi:hypothetical protein